AAVGRFSRQHCRMVVLRGVFAGARWRCALFHHRDKIHRADGALSGILRTHGRMHRTSPVIDVAISAACSGPFRARGRDRKQEKSERQTENGTVEPPLHFDFLLSAGFFGGSQSSMPTMASSSATATW